MGQFFMLSPGTFILGTDVCKSRTLIHLNFEYLFAFDVETEDIWTWELITAASMCSVPEVNLRPVCIFLRVIVCAKYT